MSRAPSIVVVTAIATAAALATAATAAAHGLQVARLEWREHGDGRVTVLLHEATGPGRSPGLDIEAPAACAELAPRRDTPTDEGVMVSWSLRCPDPLPGAATLTLRWRSREAAPDVLARVERPGAALRHVVLTPDAPSLALGASASAAAAADTAATAALAGYARLGVEHVLTGWDHLAFLLALLLLSRGWRRTALTVTAFTAGHSLTLSLAALGHLRAPPALVEALIALSVLLLAVELTRASPGLAARRPWLAAGGFGLLHGLGFAGALAEIGLPAGEIPWALAGFNLGVEAGQLAVVAAALAVAAAARRASLPARVRAASTRVAVYAIGSLACFWLVERVAAFPGGTP